MPEIPKSLGPRVLTAPLPAPLANPGMASAAAFGAPIAQGLGRGGLTVLEANRQAEEDRDDIEALAIGNEFNETDHQRMAEFRQRQGGNAKGLLEEAGTDYRKRQEEFEKRLTTPGAKEKFRRMTDARWSNRNAAILGEHMANELEKYETQTMEGTIQSEELDALDLDTDDGLVAADRRIYLTRQALADRKGLSAPERDLLARADRESLFSKAITRQIQDGDWKGAKARLDKFGQSALSAPKRAELEAHVRSGMTGQQAQENADQIMSDPNQTKAKAYEEVKKIKDAELRQKTAVNVERAFAQREAVKAETQGATYEAAADAINAGASYDELVAKNPAMTAVLDENQTASLRRVEQNAINRREPEEWGQDYTAARNSASYYPEDFAKQDLRLLKGKVRKSEYDDLNQRQQSIRAMLQKQEDKTPDATKGFLTVDDQVKASLRSIGIEPDKVKGQIDPRATRFNQLMDKKVRAAGGVTKVTPEQVKQFADDLIVDREVHSPSGWISRAIGSVFGPEITFGTGTGSTKKVRTFEVPGYENAAYTVDQIPAPDRTKATEALRAAGVSDPTPAELVEYHNLTIFKNAQAP